MTRSELEAYLAENYGAVPDHPWLQYPEYEVFRHPGSRKWFALVMVIPASRLGLKGDAPTDVVNLRCGPILGSTLREEPGFYPAYHMNKENWITAALDGSASDETLRMLLELGYRAAAPAVRRKKSG